MKLRIGTWLTFVFTALPLSYPGKPLSIRAYTRGNRVCKVLRPGKNKKQSGPKDLALFMQALQVFDKSLEHFSKCKVCCFFFFLISVTKYLMQTRVEAFIRAYSQRGCPIVAREAWQQAASWWGEQTAAACYMVSTGEPAMVITFDACSLTIHFLQPPPPKCSTHFLKSATTLWSLWGSLHIQTTARGKPLEG